MGNTGDRWTKGSGLGILFSVMGSYWKVLSRGRTVWLNLKNLCLVERRCEWNKEMEILGEGKQMGKGLCTVSPVGVKGEEMDAGGMGSPGWACRGGTHILVGSWRRLCRGGDLLRGHQKLDRGGCSLQLSPPTPVHQMKLSRPCASSPSPAHLSCPM